MKEKLNYSSESNLATRLNSNQFAITAEITPPISGDADDVIKKVIPLKDTVDAINVTDGPNANVHMSSLATSAIMQRNKIEPIVQITCRDRNRIALISDLLGISALGIKNMLILTGDDPKSGDQPTAKPVFDLKSHELIKIASQMVTEGTIPSQNKKTPNIKSISKNANFIIGAADVPTDNHTKKWSDSLKVKQQSGANFIQTQLCYDMKIIRSYAKLLINEGYTRDMFFLIGNGPLGSVRSATWMRDNLWGVKIPDDILKRLDHANDPKEEGIKICIEQMEEMSEINGISGVHLMAPINTKSIPVAISEANIIRRK